MYLRYNAIVGPHVTKGRETLRFSALVKMDGNQGYAEFTVDSQHGGKIKKRVTLKIGS